MSNTQRLGSIWRGRAWDDGEPIPRLALPDSTLGEAVAALAYYWNATSAAFQRATIDNATGGIIVSDSSTAFTPSRAFANVAAGTTDGNIVTAVTSKKIRVLALVAVCGATATTVTFNTKPGGAGSAVSATFQNAANGGEALPFCPVGWFDTNAGEGLTATTGAGSTTGVQVVYITV